jgi:hypothetical protein
VNIQSGLWRCFVCAEGNEKGGGNSYVFLRILHKYSVEATKPEEFVPLLKERFLSFPETLKEWGICKSITTNDWLMPGYNNGDGLTQLYRLCQTKEGKRWLLTPTLGHGLMRPNDFDESKPHTYICEGPWDGLALYEVMLNTKRNDDGSLALTANPSLSLHKECNVVAVPGCGSIGEPFKKWLHLFTDRIVTLMFDNDHPRKHPKTGQPLPPAGLVATQKAIELLGSDPQEIRYLQWGPDGYDLDLPSGFDLSDAICKEESPTGFVPRPLAARTNAFETISGLVVVSALEGLRNDLRRSNKLPSTGSLDLLPCSSYRELTLAWRKAMKWIDGLDHGLVTMLSSVISTMTLGDQLWFKIMGPPSSGKSTLCEAISTAKEYVLAKSTIRGFHSGSSDNDEDNSLIVQMKSKTLVVKDADTILKMPGRDQMLSEARDIYDTVSRASYRIKKVSRDYEGVRTSMLWCGTSALRELDASELGARFLDCYVMKEIDDELEDDINWRVANRSLRLIGTSANGKPETRQDPDMTTAMQLTGGYVNYLRENAETILSAIYMDEAAVRFCTRLGKFVALLRARPSTKQSELVQRELGARLVSVLVRYACCCAGVLNYTKVNDEVLNRTARIACDTADGISLNIASYLYNKGSAGAEAKGVSLSINEGDAETRAMLRFLKKIKVVEVFEGKANKNRWRLTERMRKLYADVMLRNQEEDDE